MQIPNVHNMNRQYQLFWKLHHQDIDDSKNNQNVAESGTKIQEHMLQTCHSGDSESKMKGYHMAIPLQSGKCVHW